MNTLRLLRRNFDHGVHPAHHKKQTEDLAIQRVPFVSDYVMPLGQHIGVPSQPVVEVGERVNRGQLIAKPGGFVSTALHSPVTGTISEIGDVRGADGVFAPAIQIAADPYATQQLESSAGVDWQSLSLEDFIGAVQMAGIVGMGGAAFPSHVKFSVPDGVKIRHLLINGSECEPYLTNDHRLMVERPEDLLLGAEIVRQKLGAEETIIGVEMNKPDAIEILRRHIQPDQPVRIVPLKVKYPQGAEKMIIKAVFDKEVPAGQLPRDVEVNVNNVGTIVAIADYFLRGLPSIERIVTVSGPGADYPANLIVPLGTPVREVLRFCGGLKDETREVILGGPMMGRPTASLDVPVLKGTSGILAFTEVETARPKEYPCIRCARCLEACPYFLNPSRFARLSRARMYDEMEQYSVMDCVECGCCTFACPSNIPIVQLIRTGKDALRASKENPE
ncbi:MAG: electron transport complex subunit RsxC [Chromatiales bacterium]|jgi:electron transport complex protein RnfC|nr:electron transport complex subunit RsxC [Chromatiales bacterium]MDP7270063.1 electron transport complex subunit RsxC [Gammaproteobacteria bacterium]HJP04598.1 electron transport complex subunit RsxC [Gammaproteobacteria bacterium]